MKAEVCPDHIHMLVEIPPKLSLSSSMGYLKGKNSTMLYEQFGELKYQVSEWRVLVTGTLRINGGQELKTHSWSTL